MVKVHTTELLKELRSLFHSNYTHTPINAYIIFANDAHASEYTSVSDQRRKFISGFGGSAGTAVVTEKGAFLWTDGRYFLEAEACLDENWTLMKIGMPNVPTLTEWLQALPAGSNVGTDPKFILLADWKNLKKALKQTEKNLIPVEENLIDIIWKKHGKPDEVFSVPYVHELVYAGLTWQEKVQSVRKSMASKHIDLMVLSALDEIAWLYNLRGSDVLCCPVFKSYSIVTMTDIYLFVADVKLTTSVKNHLHSKLSEFCVTVMPYSSVLCTLIELAKKSKKIWINDRTPAFLFIQIPKAKIHLEMSLVSIMKVIKNDIELENLKKATNRDAACLCQYFGFLKNSISSMVIDEISGDTILTSIRAKMENYVMKSFETISSVGSNSAIIHYRPTPETSRVIDSKEIYLCDSGAQYLDGTTDITRTLHFGTPTEYERECYTLVLKGQISLARAIFPQGVKGSRIDSYARSHLWSQGLEYLHGTGHGIGFFLNVHEDPVRIGLTTADIPLEAGNILSDEPGYYEDGKFGIRLENMVAVKKVDTKYHFKNFQFLGFDVFSYIPYHQKMINTGMLTKEEIIWLNDFNQACRSLITPLCEKFGFKEGLEYLIENTQHISFA